MNRVRLMRAASCAGAVLFGLLAYAPGGASAAGSDSSASLSFTGNASAAAVEFSIDSKPPPVPVSNLFDVRTPTGVSNLSSSGISQGTASVATPGNAASGLALFCTAEQHVSSFCQGVDSATSKTPLGSFPPDYPLAASSSYPENKGKPVSAKVSGAQVGKGSPGTVYPGQAVATTTASTVDTIAQANSSSLAAGTPLAISGGASKATTHQEVGKDGFKVTASTSVNNVSIAGLVRIDSVSSTATATNDGHGHITKQGSVTVSGVSAMGHPATIDQHGVSIDGHGDGGLIEKSFNNVLQQALKTSGVSVKLVPGKIKQTGRQVRVSSGSLQITYTRNVKGLPNPAQYLPCLPPGSCVVSAPNPNATYFGTTILGQIDVSNYAAPGIATSTPPVQTPGVTTPGTKPSSHFVPGQPGTPGAPGSAGTAGSPTGSAPEVAGSGGSGGSGAGIVTAGNVLTGTADRLKYIFPALFLAALAAFGGGLLRHPGRIPAPGKR